jgi:two-component sensor histidine kinase
VLAHNITELKRRDKALITKDATIREIHHRVKNNLQTVSALLRLQSRRIEDPKASQALEEAVRRVASIAIVHETLSSHSQEIVAFDEVINRILANAIEVSARTNEIEIKRSGEFGGFPSIIATPLALVLTELIHNALEHGLAEIGNYLEISVSSNDHSCKVSVIDNGKGVSDDFTPETAANLGLQIVKTLTENELNGTIEFIRREQGTQAEINFPLNF